MAVPPAPRPFQQELATILSFPVLFGRRVFTSSASLEKLLSSLSASPVRTLAYLDAGLAAAHPGLVAEINAFGRNRPVLLRLVDAPRIRPGGEVAKQGWEAIAPLLEEMISARLCRKSQIWALGGGAFLDAVGFAASLVHRGLRLVRFPSTALSQGDSGVGVKNGINAHGVKNLLGTFVAPAAVVGDLSFLATLPPALLGDGIAEALKVAIIRDRDFFRFLSEHAPRLGQGEPELLASMVQRSARLHLDHIREGGDPFELGQARPLDFGHWSAHYLESRSGYALRHGEAVAIGIALDTCYATRLGLLSREERNAVLGALRRAGLRLWHPLLSRQEPDGSLSLGQGLEEFREHLGGSLAITLPQGLGNRVEVDRIDLALVAEEADFLSRIPP